MCPRPSSFPFLLPLQIPCSLGVTKLICNSCAPYPPPTRLSEIKKRALGCCWAYVIGFGVNEKVQNTGEPMPHFFLGVGLLVFFPAFSFQILSPPPFLPLHGLCCFSEHWADSDLHCNCCAPPSLPHMGTLPKHEEDDKEMQN